MELFRIEREIFINQTLLGLGAAKSHNARWNHYNMPIVYTSQSRSLAVLEILVQLHLTNDLPNDRFILTLDVPDSLQIEILDPILLSKNWGDYPPTKQTKDLGAQFVYQSNSPILKVPSVVVEGEFNYLINPWHQDTRLIKIKKMSKLQFDSRLHMKS